LRWRRRVSTGEDNPNSGNITEADYDIYGRYWFAGFKGKFRQGIVSPYSRYSMSPIPCPLFSA
jgi:hypothetical protein